MVILPCYLLQGLFLSRGDILVSDPLIGGKTYLFYKCPDAFCGPYPILGWLKGGVIPELSFAFALNYIYIGT